jgi:CHAD domain-containing protein
MLQCRYINERVEELMFGVVSTSTLVHEVFTRLQEQLRGVPDGNAAAIHHSRVEIRRARELLWLIRGANGPEHLERVDTVVRRAARTLGRARDADILVDLIGDVGRRLRGAADLVAIVQTAAIRSRLRAQRKMCTSLELLEFAEIVQRFATRRVHGLPNVRHTRAALREQIATRARALQGAIERCGGVQFIRRLHDVRIAVKRLRYSFELADRLSVARPSGVRRLLKATQDILGCVHDRHVLLDRIDDVRTPDPILGHQADALRQLVETEASADHEDYLRRRNELLALCSECQRLGPQ